jgi:AcrR family transcriptional regulator
MTTGAIQDAFVLLLVEQGYDKVTMREIAAVAGVGLGTLYLYFPGKDSIAAVTVRAWLRRLAATVAAAATPAAPRTLEQTIRALVVAHAQTLLDRSAEWRALLYVERRISSADSYREIYREFVAQFRDALVAASDWPAALDAQRTAFNAFSIVDAVVKQALLVQDPCPAADELVGDIECAVAAYIAAAGQAGRHGARGSA